MTGNSELNVVIGTGPLGLAVVRELLTHGKLVRVVNRSGKADVPANVEIRRGDITDYEFGREACRSARAIYLCAKPPYTKVKSDFQPIMDGAIEAAAANRARLIFADNLYAYGPFPSPLTENFPEAATGPKGRARARIAAELMAAHRDGQVRAAIGRVSDFYGPGVIESTAGERIFRFALAGKAASVLGNVDAPHTYTYIDDFAGGLVTLGERDEALGQVWLIPSAETLTTRAFITLVFEELGKPVKIQAAPGWLVSLLGLFDPLIRELPEVAYQFEQPFVVDHGKFERAFGIHVTPHRQAIRKTLDWYRGIAG